MYVFAFITIRSTVPFSGSKYVSWYLLPVPIKFVNCFFLCEGFIAWIVIFYQKRVEWGATADYLSFNIMIGKP